MWSVRHKSKRTCFCASRTLRTLINSLQKYIFFYIKLNNAPGSVKSNIRIIGARTEIPGYLGNIFFLAYQLYPPTCVIYNIYNVVLHFTQQMFVF